MTFKDIPYLPGFAISKDGEVLNQTTGHLLKIQHVGKARVAISILGKKHNFRVDKLVADTYLDKDPRNRYLHNISGDPTDVSVENLEYRDYPENAKAIPDNDVYKLVLEYLNHERTLDQMAEHYGISRATVNVYIRDYCEENNLVPQYKARVQANKELAGTRIKYRG